MPNKILEGRQQTAPEGCLSEKSTRRSPKKKYHHGQKAEAASAASAGGKGQENVLGIHFCQCYSFGKTSIDNSTIIVYISLMGNNKLPLLFILPVILVFSCGSNPKPEQEDKADVVDTGSQETTVQAEKPEENFNPTAVSRDYYDSTMEEVRHFINDLNHVISSRNYNSWRAALSDDYFNAISSQENLQQLSEQPAMRTRRIVLRTPEDYFLYVVVPSRANSRVDAIEFVSRNRVKAFTINVTRTGEEQRLRLYDLEKIGNTWKIIN